MFHVSNKYSDPWTVYTCMTLYAAMHPAIPATPKLWNAANLPTTDHCGFSSISDLCSQFTAIERLRVKILW